MRIMATVQRRGINDGFRWGYCTPGQISSWTPWEREGLAKSESRGTGAAVANAVFQATGKHVRDLPIAIGKLL